MKHLQAERWSQPRFLPQLLQTVRNSDASNPRNLLRVTQPIQISTDTNNVSQNRKDNSSAEREVRVLKRPVSSLILLPDLELLSHFGLCRARPSTSFSRAMSLTHSQDRRRQFLRSAPAAPCYRVPIRQSLRLCFRGRHPLKWVHPSAQSGPGRLWW